MMDCRELHQKVYAFLDGELDPELRAVVEKHLDSCPACRADVHVERELWGALGERLRRSEPAPAALRARILEGIQASATPAPRSYGRLLASPWMPRLAMAAVLVVMLMVPLRFLMLRTPALALAAAERHGCHDLEASGPLPPCCEALAAGLGDVLGDPSAGVRVPDLEAQGLALARATRCSFSQRVVNMLAYQDRGGSRFSLYISDRDAREFKLLRTRVVNGVPQLRDTVPVNDEVHHVHGTYEVTIWQRDGLVYTWVGPSASPAYEAALRRLQQGS
jgi:mycothiol system anti-sigma-R factor